MFKHFITRPYLFWPLVKLCWCIKERGVCIGGENHNQFLKLQVQTWRYVVPNFLLSSQPFPHLPVQFPSQDSNQSHFYFFFPDFSLLNTGFISLPVTSCLYFCCPAIPWRGYTFSFYSTHKGHMEEIIPSLPVWLQSSSVCVEEQSNLLSNEGVWCPHAWVCALAAVSRLWGTPHSHVFCLIH